MEGDFRAVHCVGRLQDRYPRLKKSRSTMINPTGPAGLHAGSGLRTLPPLVGAVRAERHLGDRGGKPVAAFGHCRLTMPVGDSQGWALIARASASGSAAVRTLHPSENRPDQMARFKPGQSGNPGGRPAIVKSIQELTRQKTPEAIAALLAALKKPGERVSAASVLPAYGYGRPVQTQSLRVVRRLEDLSEEELKHLEACQKQDPTKAKSYAVPMCWLGAG